MGKRDDKDNKTALDLINLIKDLVTDELNKRDNTCVCQVVACNEDGTYNIFVVPDTRTVITNVKSMSLEVIKVGDYVYVYKFQNKLNNAIILARAGTNAADIRFVTVENFNSTITTRSSGGEGGKVDDVFVNNTSVVGDDKIARIDLTSYVQSGDLAAVAFSGDYDDLLNKPTIPTTYLKDATTNGNTLTLTKQDNTTVVYTPTFTDNDHYPTSFSWTNGTTAGPTGSLTGNSGFSAVSFPAIPAATNLQSGIVTTGNQSFKGVKSFTDGVKTSILRLYDSYNDDYSNIQSGDCSIEFSPSGGDSTYSIDDDGRVHLSNSNGSIQVNMLPNSGTNATINMPSSSGTLALIEDTKIEIVDLTTL